MTDIYDQASSIEQLERDRVVQRCRAAGKAQATLAAVRGTALDCHDCGDPISALRQAAVPGCTRCLGCEQRHEWLQARPR